MGTALYKIVPHRRSRQTAGTLLCLLFLSFFLMPDAEAACPATFGAAGNPVELVSCTDTTTTNGTSFALGVPAAVTAGDLLVAFVAKDGDSVVNTPAGWTSVAARTMGTNQGYLRIFTRIATGSEPANYTFSWAGGEAAYGAMMRYTGASGQVLSAIAGGNNGNFIAPAINTTVNNSLILRIAGRDRDNGSTNPGTIVSGADTHTGITQEPVGNGGNAMMGAAAYFNRAIAGSSNTGTFSGMGNNDDWAAATLGIEPIEFRYSMPDAVASVCGTQQVTLSVTDRLGNPITWFQGTVTLSTSAGGAGDWYDAGSLNGTLNNGTVNDGIATYQFTAADAGVATFEFQRSTTGTLNFNLNWGVFTESASFDPSFTIDNNCRFRISHDGNAGTCSAEPVTITIVDSGGTPATFYSGSITITAIGDNDPSNNGDYTVSSGSGSFANGTADDGIATYTFVQGESAVVFDFAHTAADSGVNFNVVDAGNPAYTVDGAYDPDLAVGACSLRFSHSGTSDACSIAQITLSVVDPGGTADDGIATYTFVQGESAVVFDFAHTAADSGVNFNVVDAGNPAYTVDGAYDPDLAVGACSLRFSHSGTSDACSIAQITLSVVDPGGLPITTFAGSVSLSVDTNDGTWSNIDGSGVFADGGGGTATYTFLAGDGGDVVLGYSRFTSGTVNFEATAGGGISSPGAPYDDDLVISLCTAEFSVNPTMNVCSVSETVTVTIRDSQGAVATDFSGIVVLSTSTSKGDYTIGDGAGVLANGAGNDGIATYDFDPADNGDVQLEFNTGTVENLVFNVSSTFTTFDSGASDENLQVLSCYFRINHDGEMDNCTPESVTVSVYNSAQVAVTDYVGTINLTTTSGNGTWSNDSGNGTVTDPVAEDGSATYEFVAGDNGSVQLFFANLNVETMNINVSDGNSTDSNPTYDPVLEVLACSFRIAVVDGSATACDFEAITVSIHDSAGAIVTNYTGTVSLSTNTVHGTWSDAGALNGTLTETTPEDGYASYAFSASDNGTATFNFIGDVAETLNFNAISGDIEEDSSFDPDLLVTGCVPEILEYACYSGASGGTGSLDVIAANDGRMVVMVIFHVDPSPQDVISATFGGGAMTQIYEVNSSNTGVEMWGILDADIPPTAGSYAGTYSWDAAPANTPSMCLVEIVNVDQDFPVINGSSPNLGEVNGNSFVADGNPLELSTTINTAANNAIVLSAGVKDGTNGGTSDFNGVAPVPPMIQLFFDSNDQNPVGGTGAGSYGLIPSPGSLTVIDSDQQDADTSASHIVASFNPKVGGEPSVQGYIPVSLYETLSGNISYNAIGASLRTGNSSGNSACNMSPVGTGASATLSMPAGSNVRKAYLYWAGSGEEFEADDTVTFGPTGSEVSITADQMFQVEGVGGTRDLYYFAGYKDVTSQVTSNGSFTLYDLTVQTDKPWSQTRACAGGWALVVVYDNAKERFRVANVFHGFQPVQDSSFSLIPRNFRMATTDNDAMGYVPNGKIANITLEGDENASGNEAIGIQAAPNSDAFNDLNNSFNPAGDVFNGTVTRPLLYEPGDSSFYEWDSTNGTNSDGYEIDEPGSGGNIGETWGLDIDTYYLTGNDNTGELWNFAQNGSEAEQFSTRYATGSDLVMLIAEVVTVTNFDLADLEVFKAKTQDFTVGGTGQYQFQVVNNGNGGLAGGFANGQVLVADVLPAGLTVSSVSGTSWDCSVTSSGAFTCAFDIGNDCTGATGCTTQTGQLSPGESLPVITANINVAGPATFPLASTNVKNVARLQHNGGACGTLTAGVIPDPATCTRAPQFDNVNDLDRGAIDINDLDDKTSANNNVHSVITEILGRRTDLAITKGLDGILEVGNSTSYTLTVTNYGPNSTSGGAGGTITVNDVQPAGVTFTSASGTDWSCTVGPLECTYTNVLNSGASAPPITVNVDVTGAEGDNVTNTAQVTSGTYNFDTNSSNNSATDVSTIVAAPVSAGERFMMSVRVPENTTQIGGLATFDNDDLINFNPLTDVGSLFYDDSSIGDSLDDIDAVHLYPNGHVALSTKGSSSIDGNDPPNSSLSFEPEDIVVWDPILDAVTMLFDGSEIFDGTITASHNIDAVYVRSDGRIVFSTEGAASITDSSPATVNFGSGDIVEYDPSDGSATILVANGDSGVTQLDGLYVRVDESNADANQAIYIFTPDENSVQVGACGGCTPSAGTTVTRDDIVELDNTGAQIATANQFVGHQPLGVFTNPSSSSRTIDALHVIEDGFFGHFAISQSQVGNTCQAGQITIRKHKGLTHTVDENYTGSILITTDLNQGDWSIASGNGTLVNGTADDGAARYTFVPSDNGEVTLYLTETTVSTLNVNVTNGLVQELGTEDPNFVYNYQITEVSYRDNWGAAELDNNDGSTFWATDWTEADGGGAGLASGNIIVDSGQLQMTATVGDPNPSMSRQADLSLFNVTETTYLNLDYSYQFLNSGSDVLNIDISLNGGTSYTNVYSFSGIGGTNLTPQSLSLNLDSLLGSPTWTNETTIRFRIGAGYTGTSRMFLDNIELVTGTRDCGIGSMEHYEITVNGTTGTSGTLVSGLQCLSAVVTVEGHDLNHFPSASAESVTLRTSTNKGDWILAAGQLGSLTNGTPDDGIATYTFAPSQQTATFIFNYTNPASDPEQVNFNVSSAYPVNANEDPTLNVYEAGLLFYNETAGGPTSSSPIPVQIAGKSSNVAPSITILNIEGVRSSDNDPLACSPLFDAGNNLTIEFAAECLDPGTCSGSNNVSIASLAASNNSRTLIAASDNAAEGTSGSYQTLDVLMASQPGSRVGGEVYFSYADAGQIELHARYQVPLNEDISGASGYGEGYLSGSSAPIVVRPFGFDIDFSDDRFTNGTGGASYAADADGSVFATSGIGFDTTVTAVAWEQADDMDNDGVPDDGASLGNNAITPNFGNESTAGNYEVLIERFRSVLPLNSTYGSLSDNRFFVSNTESGSNMHSMTYDEVGIIDLSARLVNAGTTDDGDFLGAGVNVYGNVKNVGRFIPGHFELSNGAVISRELTDTEPRIDNMPSFTYMGEEFGISATVTVFNGASPAEEVHNYVGTLAKLGNRVLDAGNVDLAANKFVAVDSSGSPVNYSTRIGEANNSSRAMNINWEAAPSITSQAKTLSGNLIFNRASPAAPDGPLTLDVGLATTDPDTVGFTLDLDVDDGQAGSEAVLIEAEEFRYGRLLIDNAYGSELEPLGIGFTVEYFDSSIGASGEFVLNTDDSTTTIMYDASENASANRSMYFVSGTFTDNLLEDVNDILEVGETFIEASAISGNTDVKTSISRGRTVLSHSSQQDTPFYASAPGENRDGSAIVEFNLTDSSLPFPLDFLSYGWRGAGEDEDINNEANDYSDNPRGQVGFGSYRGHDRVLNWREIYTSP